MRLRLRLHRKTPSDRAGQTRAEGALAAATDAHREARERTGEIMETVKELRRAGERNNFAETVRAAFTPPPKTPHPRGAE
jgi:hypothetical protein